MIAAGGTRQPKIMKRSAELPLIASALRFALDSPRRQLQIQERLERRLYLPAPEHRGSWFVLRHGSGEVEAEHPRTLYYNRDNAIHPCLVPEDANAWVA
jgi:hypothetical protein